MRFSVGAFENARPLYDTGGAGDCGPQNESAAIQSNPGPGMDVRENLRGAARLPGRVGGLDYRVYGSLLYVPEVFEGKDHELTCASCISIPVTRWEAGSGRCSGCSA